jgi:uncharacterized iron-regulated membrane protein
LSVRRTLRWAHRWVGLAAGCVLVVTGLTGSALVFRQEIDSALNPALLRVEPAPARASLQSIADEIRRRFPDAPAAARVRMPRGPHDAYEFWMGAEPALYVYADPYRGTILGARGPRAFLTGWLFWLHSHMLSGEVGHTIAGIAALALVGLSLTGLVIWWPRRPPWSSWKQWHAALTIKRGSGSRRVTFDLHRALGFYASAFLLVAGVTGASLVFNEWFERAAHVIVGTSPVKVSSTVPVLRASPAPATLPLDTLLAIAEAAQPGGTISYLYLATTPGQTFRVRQRLPGEEHPNGKSFVNVDPTSGRVVGVESGALAPTGARLYSILYPLHIGILGGTATRLLAVLVGLSLPALAVSGALIWWRRGH